MKQIEIGYVADAIIKTKQERFGEYFITIKEVLLIANLMVSRAKESGLDIEFIDDYFNNYFEINNGIITKIEETDNLKNNFKMYIQNKEICDFIYDDEFIRYCLYYMMYNKIRNSIKHTCSNCNVRLCVMGRSQDDDYSDECECWKYDFGSHAKSYLSDEERSFIYYSLRPGRYQK